MRYVAHVYLFRTKFRIYLNNVFLQKMYSPQPVKVDETPLWKCVFLYRYVFFNTIIDASVHRYVRIILFRNCEVLRLILTVNFTKELNGRFHS